MLLVCWGRIKKHDIGRIRTCAGEPKRFLVSRLNHSATMSSRCVPVPMQRFKPLEENFHFAPIHRCTRLKEEHSTVLCSNFASRYFENNGMHRTLTLKQTIL